MMEIDRELEREKTEKVKERDESDMYICIYIYIERENLSKSIQTVSSSNNANEDESSKGSKVYDAILMDFMMPNKDGSTATEIIKGMGYTGPVIGITGKSYSHALEIQNYYF